MAIPAKGASIMTLNNLIEKLQAIRCDHGGDITVLVATDEDPNGCEYFAPEVVDAGNVIYDYPDHNDREVIYEGAYVVICP
jgi:hypothetical protein